MKDEFSFGAVMAIYAIALVIDIWVAHTLGKAAEKRGYAYFPWFVAGFFFPLLGHIIAWMVITSLPDKRRMEMQERQKRRAHFPCPQCGEEIKSAAKVCHYCKATILNTDRSKTITRRFSGVKRRYGR